MYGNTESAAEILATKLCERGCTNVVMYDVSNTHVSQLISETFRLSHVVLASVTYNLGIYPVMKDYLMHMQALNLQNRTFAILENGSWAPKSGALMTQFVEEHLKNSEVLENPGLHGLGPQRGKSGGDGRNGRCNFGVYEGKIKRTPQAKSGLAGLFYWGC